MRALKLKDLADLPPCRCRHAADQHWLKVVAGALPAVGACGVPDCKCREYGPKEAA
jgi:hypothetical protein